MPLRIYQLSGNFLFDQMVLSSIPFDQIENCQIIGISSGASAPEILVENFINDLKNKFSRSIEEVEIIKEDVVFKVPNKLN